MYGSGAPLIRDLLHDWRKGWPRLIVLRPSGNAATSTDSHRLALGGGPFGLVIALAPIQELDPERLDATSNIPLVGLVAIVFLIWLWQTVRLGQPPPVPREKITSRTES